MKKRIGIILGAVMLCSSCDKVEENEGFDPISSIPEISLDYIGPMSVDQFGTVTFHIGYIDGNGDIGTEDPDIHSLEILDTRDNILHGFHVPPQSPVENIAITGVLVVDLENVILLDQDNDSENVRFEIRLKDRDGHWSEVILSPAVTISK